MPTKREFSVRKYTFETAKYSCPSDGSVQTLIDVHTTDTDDNGKMQRVSFGELFVQHAVYNGAHFTHNFQILSTTAGALDLHDRNIVTNLLRIIIAGQKNQIVYN